MEEKAALIKKIYEANPAKNTRSPTATRSQNHKVREKYSDKTTGRLHCDSSADSLTYAMTISEGTSPCLVQDVMMVLLRAWCFQEL